VNIKLSPEARRMLRAMAKRRRVPQSEVIEGLIRGEYEK